MAHITSFLIHFIVLPICEIIRSRINVYTREGTNVVLFYKYAFVVVVFHLLVQYRCSDLQCIFVHFRGVVVYTISRVSYRNSMLVRLYKFVT